MIPGVNAVIIDSKITNETAEKELTEITAKLDERFELYKPSIAWILETAELLKKYQLLTGETYEIKIMEDSII